jgi:creatinine amidohydrolase
MLLEDITMTNFADGLEKTKTLILPLGTVEEHGKHLPLSTDTIVVYEVAKMAAKEIPLFVAPPLHYGVCTSTGQHAGTIGISFDTLRASVEDIVKSSYEKGLRNFVVISGHAGGSHATAMREAGEELIHWLPESKIAVLTVYDLILKEALEIADTENDSHAGEIETSLILTMAPDLVKGSSPEEYPTFPKPFIVRNKLKYWPGGVWGNPAKATKEKGEQVFNLAVEKLVKLVRDLEAFQE